MKFYQKYLIEFTKFYLQQCNCIYKDKRKRKSDNPKTYIANLIYKNYNIGVYMLITRENESNIEKLFFYNGFYYNNATSKIELIA